MSEVLDVKIKNNAMDLEMVRSQIERLLGKQLRLLKEKKELQLIKKSSTEKETKTKTPSD